MSTKTSKRRQKRLNTNEEEVELSDKSLTPKKIDESITKETINENDEQNEDKTETKQETTEEQNGHKIEENGQNEQNGDHHEEKNGVSEEITENKVDESEISTNNQDSELLVIVDTDTEEDIQLTVEDTQEKDLEKSPVLTGMTTRSHKSSPKIDKSENGTDTKITNEVRVNITRIEEENLEEIQLNESTKDDENKTVDSEEKDTTNASIFVNLGNDTTRNIDITTTSVLEETVSNSFIEVNKDISYGQALRTLSGRRTLRRDSPYVHRGKLNLEKDVTDARKSYIPHISSVKRKATGEIPDDSKRHKAEGSPGIFSYISSPLNSFRNKISRSELPSSTPKLTSYNKYAQGNNIIDDMSHIELDEKAEPKKWCSVM